MATEKRHVFVSYERRAKPWALWVDWLLQKAGQRVFFAPNSIRGGEDFPRRLAEAIEQGFFLALYSRHYDNSSWCSSELQHAMEAVEKDGRVGIVQVEPLEKQPFYQSSRHFANVWCKDRQTVIREICKAVCIPIPQGLELESDEPAYPNEHVLRVPQSVVLVRSHLNTLGSGYFIEPHRVVTSGRILQQRSGLEVRLHDGSIRRVDVEMEDAEADFAVLRLQAHARVSPLEGAGGVEQSQWWSAYRPVGRVVGGALWAHGIVGRESGHGKDLSPRLPVMPDGFIDATWAGSPIIAEGCVIGHFGLPGPTERQGLKNVIACSIGAVLARLKPHPAEISLRPAVPEPPPAPAGLSSEVREVTLLLDGDVDVGRLLMRLEGAGVRARVEYLDAWGRHAPARIHEADHGSQHAGASSDDVLVVTAGDEPATPLHGRLRHLRLPAEGEAARLGQRLRSLSPPVIDRAQEPEQEVVDRVLEQLEDLARAEGVDAAREAWRDLSREIPLKDRSAPLLLAELYQHRGDGRAALELLLDGGHGARTHAIRAWALDQLGLLQMVRIPGGVSGRMAAEAPSLPEQRVAPFDLARTPVTRALYKLVTERRLERPGDRRPQVEVTWLDAARFCNQLSELLGRVPAYEDTRSAEACAVVPDADGFRLPTDAEWIHAAALGRSRPPRDPLPPGASVDAAAPDECGVIGLLGLVNEWLFDWHGDGRRFKAVRGSSWLAPCYTDHWVLNRWPPEWRRPTGGFRVAASIPLRRAGA